MKKTYVGQGRVVLIAGGGKLNISTAAQFCNSECTLEDLINLPYSHALSSMLIDSPHKAALEFDDFIWAVEGYARVTETQLVRKRHASYMIHSGRGNHGNKRSYDVVLPKSLDRIKFPITNLSFINKDLKVEKGTLVLSTDELLNILETYYNIAVNEFGVPDEEARYMKPQGTAFRGLIKMNGAGLKDWMQIRLCNKAQTEIRSLASEMLRTGMEAAPDLFSAFGPSCTILGYCPEPKQCSQLSGKIPTKQEALEILRLHYSDYKKGTVIPYPQDENSLAHD